MRLHFYICIVVFGSFRGEEGDSNSVMDLSHINQDKMLPEVSFGQPRDENEKFSLSLRKVFRVSGQCVEKGKRPVLFSLHNLAHIFSLSTGLRLW